MLKVVCCCKCLFESFCVLAQYVLRQILQFCVCSVCKFLFRGYVKKHARDCVFCVVYVYMRVLCFSSICFASNAAVLCLLCMQVFVQGVC